MPKLSAEHKEFIKAYFAAALWSSSDNEPGYCEERDGYIEPTALDAWDGEISLHTIIKMHRRCHSFLDVSRRLLEEALKAQPGLTYSQAGHDFWLTHNHHGAGFWDGDWPEPMASRLTTRASTFDEIELYIGDNGTIYS